MVPKPNPAPSRPPRGNLAGLVADRLRAAILRGEYEIDQPLREVELCRVLGVSRIPVREALHRLEGEGLVEIRPNRGAVVARLSTAELHEVAEVCRLLEGHVLRLSVPLLMPELLEQAAELITRMDAADDAFEWTTLNWSFHTTLYAGAQRPLEIEFLTGLRARVERAMYLLTAEKARRVVLNVEHRALLAAVRERSAARASELLDKHLSAAEEKVVELVHRA